MDEWRARAACRGMDVNQFMPEASQGRGGHPALKVCATCPVIHQCLQYALMMDDITAVGVWGGTTDRHRRRIRRHIGLRINTPDPRKAHQ